jgi:hypothetical protein
MAKPVAILRITGAFLIKPARICVGLLFLKRCDNNNNLVFENYPKGGEC